MKGFWCALAAAALWCSGTLPATVGAAETQNESHLEQITHRGVIRIGLKKDVEGFSLKDPATGEYIGFEADLAGMVAKKLGVTPEYTTVTPATRIDLLKTDNLDLVIANFTITPQRQSQVDFSIPYFNDRLGVMVNRDSGFKVLRDLIGKKVAVVRSTTAPYALIKKLAADQIVTTDVPEEQNFDPLSWTDSVTFAVYDYYSGAVEALENKQVDAFCADQTQLESHRKSTRVYLKDFFGGEEFAMATRKGSDLIPELNKLLEQWQEDGTIAELLMQYGLEP